MAHLNSDGYDTDKGPAYIRHYERFFAPYRMKPINFLEMGINRGGSLKMWRDYFQFGQIFGLDINPPDIGDYERIHVFRGDATEAESFQTIEEHSGCGEFDIIIDDASHIGIFTKQSFEQLFVDRLTPGGLYVLEDWGTGYISGWPDGERYDAKEPEAIGDSHRYRFPSHDYGMVGYLKHLVDVAARADVGAGGGLIEDLPIEHITITPDLAFIQKSA